MKYIKVFIALFLTVELIVFAYFLRGVYLDPKKMVEKEDGKWFHPKLSELTEDYRIWKFISLLPFTNHYENLPYDPKGAVNVSITGDYLPSDSLFLDSLMGQLNNLMEVCQLKWGSVDYKKFNIKMVFKKNQTEFGKALSHYKKGGKDIRIYIFLFDSVSVNEREKYICSRLIRNLFNIRIDSNLNKEYNFPSNAIVTTNDWRLAEFKEIDKQILQRFYTKYKYLKLFIKYPVLLFDMLKISHFNKQAKILYDFNSFLLIGLYFIFLIRLGIFRKQNITWLQYNKQALFVCIAIVLLIIFQSIYKVIPGSIAIFGPPYIKYLILLFVFLIGLLLANIIYFVEYVVNHLKIDFNSKFLLKTVSSFLIASVPIIITLIMMPDDDLFVVWILFVIFILGARAIMMYQNHLIENAVKEKDLELAQLKATQQQSELQAIHSRINPHFLYNSLNSIASLAGISPEKTEKMALALSRFFRFAINKNNEEFVKVKDELEVVETYLEIEKIRFGEKLQYKISCKKELKETAVPRFIIQPLVENAIKHGVSNIMEEGHIKVELKMTGEFLTIRVSDNGKDFPEDPLYGYGLQSIYDKLKLYYKGEAHIELDKNPDKAIVLYLPLTKKWEEIK